jgi:hypothetical protein
MAGAVVATEPIERSSTALGSPALTQASPLVAQPDHNSAKNATSARIDEAYDQFRWELDSEAAGELHGRVLVCKSWSFGRVSWFYQRGNPCSSRSRGRQWRAQK